MKILKTMYHVTRTKTTSSEFVKVTEAVETKKGTTTATRRWVGSNEKEKEKKEFGKKKEGKMMMMMTIE